MECKTYKASIHKYLDNEIESTQSVGLENHLLHCAFCQREAESFRALGKILKSVQVVIEPSQGFESAFWNRAVDRPKEPWFLRAILALESFVPAPSLSQAFAV